MKSIDITPYKVKIRGLDESGNPFERDEDYNIKDSLVTVLFARGNHLTAKQTLFHNKIANKIEASKDTLILEDAEYEALKKSFDTIQGFSRNDVEVISRVMEAKEYMFTVN